MTRRNRRHIIILVALTILYGVAEYGAPKPINWTSTFKPTDTIPYGTFLVTELLEKVFPDDVVLTTDLPLHSILEQPDSAFPRPSNLLIVNGTLAREGVGINFSIDEYDANLLFDFVNEGGHVFLAGERFSGPLADSLNVQTTTSYSIASPPPGDSPADASDPDSFAAGENNEAQDTDAATEKPAKAVATRRVTFANPGLDGLSFDVPERLTGWYFSSVDTLRTTVIANLISSDQKNANLIRIDHGDGSFYLSSTPYAFTNFAVIDSTIAGWTFAALSHLPDGTTIWNSNYIPGRGQASGTPLRFVLSTPPLKWAWFIILASGTLFILFRAKRRQRIIPVVTPHTNATLEFVDSVGRLYFQRANHKDLAEKKIAHFGEYIRTHLRIEGHLFEPSRSSNSSSASVSNGGNVGYKPLDEKTKSRIASRAGVSAELVELATAAIEHSRTLRNMKGDDLLRLSKPIDEFYALARR